MGIIKMRQEDYHDTPEIQTAIRLLLLGELAKHALKEPRP